MRAARAAGVRVGGVTLLALGSLLLLGEHQRHGEHRAQMLATLRQATVELAPHAVALFATPVGEADAELRRWAAASGARVTLIASGGRVIADSWTLPPLLDRLENHTSRPELRAAAGGEVGVAWRRSVTTDRPTLYVAVPVLAGDALVGYLRFARETAEVEVRWHLFVLAALAASLAGAWAAWSQSRRQRAIAKILAPWTELPAAAESEALAEEADRAFRAGREELSRELGATRAALAEIGEGVVLLDSKCLVRYANAAAGRLLGGDLQIGRPLVEAARSPELQSAVAAVGKDGQPRHASSLTTGGVEIAISVFPLREPTLCTAVVLRDLQGQRQLERARRALVGDLAHELRTPLTVLGGLAEELRLAGQNEEQVAALERQVRRLRVFAEELEELAAIESGQLRLEREKVAVLALAQQVLHDHAEEARDAAVALSTGGEEARLVTDPVRLAQILGNLVSNGIRYNRPGGRVTVRAASAEGAVRVEVEDDGIGIPAAEIPLVFQRFYRVRRGARPEGGSGLGLAIVKHLMQALGGTVNLASREGEGTTVTLTFPRPPGG
ncbi:MAG: ATP-binding protein [Acidobacteriota bacterium]